MTSQVSSFIAFIEMTSVPAEIILDAVSGKAMVWDSLTDLTMCFLHLSVLKKQPFLIEMPSFLPTAGQ